MRSPHLGFAGWAIAAIGGCVWLGLVIAAASGAVSRSEDALLLGVGAAILGVGWIARGSERDETKRHPPMRIPLIALLGSLIVWLVWTADRSSPGVAAPESRRWLSGFDSLLAGFPQTLLGILTLVSAILIVHRPRREP